MLHNLGPRQPLNPGENPFITFSDATGLELSWDQSRNRSVVLLDSDVPYPTAEQSVGMKLSDLLLEEIHPDADDKRRTLILPENFVTMAQALNDVTSGSATGSAVETGENLFQEVGEALGRLAEHDGILPVRLSYHNFIFSREHHDPKLLPPVLLTEVDASEMQIAKSRVVEDFWQSCVAGVDSVSQQTMIPGLFDSFVRSFRGQNDV